MPAKPLFHRTPLMAHPYSTLPLTAIRPAGWLHAQLALQADALREVLAQRWPDVADAKAPMQEPADWPCDIALLGAVLPLAYLLEDDLLLAAAQKRIHWALAQQNESGCIPPHDDGDEAWCSRAAFMQLLMRYYTVTADKQLLVYMLRYAKHALERIGRQPLQDWALARAGELLMPVLWLYEVTGKEFLLELARALQAQGIDWTAFCHTMPYRTSMDKQIQWRKLHGAMKRGSDDSIAFHRRLFQQTHAANIALGLKMPALIAHWTGGIKHAEAFDHGYAKLMRAHGLAPGLFSGDDLLGGALPARGILCEAISGLMASLETLLALQGKAAHGDLLERLAYNALPAAYSDDMCARQRVQQPNQVSVQPALRNWYNAEPDANCFLPLGNGEDANSAVLHHGFPQFAASMWMATADGGLAAVAYAPCTVRARAGETAVRIDVETAYPYEETVSLRISTRVPSRFPLHLRIPAWAKGAELVVAGEPVACAPGGFAVIDREWTPGDTVSMRFPLRVERSAWYHGSVAVERGPLLLAYAPETKESEEWVWAYALRSGGEDTVQYNPAQVGAFGQGVPLSVEVDAMPVPTWGLKQYSADSPPMTIHAEGAEAVRIRLVPYGGTSLRICQFPIAK